MIILLLSLLLAVDDELKPGVVSPPQERSVKYVQFGDKFAKDNLVRLLPLDVSKVKVGKKIEETIKAKCVDPKDPFKHRYIRASDFEGDDKKWFEREAKRLWHNQEIEEAKKSKRK